MKTLHVGALLALFIGFVGCEDAQKIEPLNKGSRGETCLARNDCRDGLACVMGVCSQNDFDISVTAKQCVRVECEEDEDCCGDKPLEAPAKCDDRVKVCETPGAADCIATLCTEDAECGEGTCTGRCSYAGTVCLVDADCTTNLCSAGLCTFSGTACTVDADCDTCVFGTGTCDCTNPDYDPSAAICSDPDCVDVCLERCEDRLCQLDTSCRTDDDCLGLTESICEGGKCVQCVENEDCNEDNDEECVNSVCEKPCDVDEECGIFEECDGGECVHVGCQSDRECVLFAAGQIQRGELGANVEARRFQCLAATDDPDRKICRVPCENDVECGQFEVCAEDGFCKFVGCQDDADCRAALGLEHQVLTEDKPYYTTSVCEDE